MNALNGLAAIDFIPHGKPMVFVDDLIEEGDHFAIAQLTIRPELMFCEAEGLPTWSSIELMAQTVSLYAGIQSQKVGKAPKIGFLLGTRKLHLPVPFFAMGDVVTIRAERQYLHEGLGQFACEIQYQGHTINAMLSVYEPEEHQ